MPRDRMLRLQFWDDQYFMENTNFFDRLLFIGCWNFANDIGVLEYRLKNIKKWLFYYDNGEGKEDVTLENTREGVRTLASIGCIVVYESPENGRKLIYVRKFSDYQSVPKPTTSLLPRPDGSKDYTRTPKKVKIVYDSAMDSLINKGEVADKKPANESPHKTIKKKPAKKKDKKKLTPLQTYMLFFKEFIGIMADDTAWDKLYYKRFVRDVTALLEYLDDVALKTEENVIDVAIKATREIVSNLKNKGLSWSLQGAVMKALPEWKIKYCKRTEQAKKYTAMRKKEEEERLKLIEETSSPEYQEGLRELFKDMKAATKKGKANG